jgi:hypothetical protein
VAKVKSHRRGNSSGIFAVSPSLQERADVSSRALIGHGSRRKVGEGDGSSPFGKKRRWVQFRLSEIILYGHSCKCFIF